MKDSLKKIVSLLLSLALIVQLVPGIVNSTKMDSDEITIDDIKKLNENSELFHLEVLKDSEGNAKIEENSITWKLVYNKAKEKLKKNKFELVLSEGLDLEYSKENGDLDLDTQPIYLDEIFKTFDSEILNDESLEYELEEGNINNKDKILSFSNKSEGIYDIVIEETESTEEIIFTTKLTDEETKDYFAYIVLDGKEKFQSNSEVNIRPRTKINIPVNIKWVDLKEEIELLGVEIELKNSDEIIERRVLNPGLNDTVFENLYKYDLKGKEIKYSINQIPIEGFETSVLDYEITNRYIDEELKKIEEEIKATVEELLKPTEVEKRLPSSNEIIEEEKVDSVNDIIKEPINEKEETLESTEDSKEIKEENKEELKKEEVKKEDKEENDSNKKIENEIVENEIVENEKASPLKIDEKNKDELKEEKDNINNEMLFKTLLTEENNLSVDTDEKLEMAPMSLMSIEMLRNATRSTGIIVPPLSEPKLFSTSEKPGMDWSAEANFDGLGNIVWTIKMSKIATPFARYFEMAIKNISGSALDISSDEAYYELSSNRESSSVIESINKTTGNILVSTRLSSANWKNEEVTFKIITPIRELKDEYTLNVRPGVFHTGATPGLWPDTWQYMGNKSNGSQDLTIERPKSRGKLKIKLTADSPEAYKTKKFTIKSGDGNSIERTTDSNGEILIENLDTSLDYTIEQNEVHDGYNPDPEPIRYNIKIPANGEKLVEFINTKKKLVQVGINLVDNTDTPLNAGTFILYNEAGNAIGKIEGDIIGGKALFKSDSTNEPIMVEVGTKYKIVQLSAKQGYAKSEDIIFTAKDSPESIHYEKVVNTKSESVEGRVTVNVFEPDSETLVGKGVAFVGIYDQYDNIVMPEKATDENGKVVFDHIPLGNYKIRITNVAPGYIPADEEVVQITSTDYSPTKNLILKSEGDTSGPKLQFKYYNETSKSWELIPNTDVRFLVKTAAGIKIEGPKTKLSTQDSFKIEKLTKNNEYIIEYYGEEDKSDYLDNYYAFAPTKFTYNTENEFWTIKVMERKIIENSKYTSKVHIKLTEDGTKALAGGRFRLEAIGGDASEMKYKFEGTTDKDGNLYFNELPKGKYKLTQVVVPYMHEGLTEAIADFEITTDKETKEFSLINKPKVLQTPIELPTIEPKYNIDGQGEYSTSYYPEGDSLYRNRDNKIDKRMEPNYSIPAYSEYRGQGASISEDKDVIENERAFLWKYAEPSKKGNHVIPGEYFINLAVEGKKPNPPPTTDVVFVLDNSNSMNEKFDNKNSSTSDNKISRMELLKQSVITLVDKTFPTGVSPSDINVRMGLVNFGHDYIDSVDLTKNPELLKSKLKTKGAGGTFTQEGLIKANEILKDSTADNRLVVLISDGAPTKSYRLNNMTGLSLEKFGNASLIDGPEHIKGDGAANDLTTGEFKGYEDYISVHKKYTVRGPSGEKTSVDDHNLATLSEAENIKNNGIEIHSIGINIAADTALISGGYLLAKDAKENLINISSGNGYYHFVDGTFFDQILWDIIPISDKSIIDGVVTDPMGSQVILSNKHNFTQAAKIDEYLVNGDYHLEFSSAEVEKRFKDNGSKVLLEGNTIKFDKLTLGEREWVKLRYKVNLNTEDPNFNPDEFYLTNGKETTLEYNPKLSTDKYKFGVPAIKLGAINLKITKEWEDFQVGELPGNVSFKVIRTVENDSGEYPPEAEWEIVEDNIILTANNNWTWENGKYIRYNNEGKEFKYKAIEITTSDLYDLVMNEEKDPITGNYHFKAINIAKKGKFIVLKLDESTEPNPLSGAEFTLFKKDSTGDYKKVEGSDSQNPEMTVTNPQTTDANGNLIFKGLKPGVYYLKETKAPDGYAINDSYLEIVVNSANSNIVEFNIPANDKFWSGENGTDNSVGYIALRDEPAHPIIIEKVDEDGNTIIKNSPEFNAVFDIYNREDYDANTEKFVENAKPIAKDLAIGSDGRVKSESVFAINKEYWLVEKRQPTGYFGLSKPISIILKKSGDNSLNWEIGAGYEEYANSFTDTNAAGETIIGIKVINKKIEIPHTGGEGSRIFTIIGLLLMGAVVLIRRKV